jgi:hypothetical protein
MQAKPDIALSIGKESCDVILGKALRIASAVEVSQEPPIPAIELE